MATELSESLQGALKGLAATLQAGAGDAAPSTARRQLSQLCTAVDALLQQHDGVLRSLEARAAAERGLRNVVGSKEAEAARLRGEITRLRHASEAGQPAAAADAGAAGGAAVDDGGSRQAVLDAAVAAKDKPTALLHQLESEAAACHARISALEADLAAVTADATSRLAEQHKGFLAKLEQLRAVHGQQQAAAAAEAQAQLQAEQARCRELELQLAAARRKLGQQEELTGLLQQQVRELGSKVASSQRSSKQPPPQVPQQQAGVGTSLQSAAACGSPEPAKQPPGADKAAAAAAEVTVLQQMEAQLAKLSSVIRAHQSERDQLRSTLTAGCAERQALQAEALELRRQLQQLQAAADDVAAPHAAAAKHVASAMPHAASRGVRAAV